MPNETIMNQISDYVKEGLITDGGHHKQFYLYQIAKVILSDNDLELLNNEINDCGTPP